LAYRSIKQRKENDNLSAKSKQRPNAIGSVLFANEKWEKGFAALTKFKAREGHCRVTRFYIEGTYKLGPWASTQRYKRETMSAEHRMRLDAIGFLWNWRDYLWENGFAALKAFKAREGHCRVPSLHIEQKFKLGQWVSTQRRRKDIMTAERRTRLNKIGFVWHAK
jgi:hypothetical protein